MFVAIRQTEQTAVCYYYHQPASSALQTVLDVCHTHIVCACVSMSVCVSPAELIDLRCRLEFCRLVCDCHELYSLL